MQFYWLKYRLSDGQPVLNGWSSSRAEIPHQADAAHGVIEVDADASSTVEIEIGGRMMLVNIPDIEVARRTICRRIDDAALARMHDPFASIHAVKLAEARGTGPRPLLAAEAAEAGVSEQALADQVLARAELAAEVNAAVDRKRIAAKAAVRAAATVPEIVAAGDVEWDEGQQA